MPCFLYRHVQPPSSQTKFLTLTQIVGCNVSSYGRYLKYNLQFERKTIKEIVNMHHHEEAFRKSEIVAASLPKVHAKHFISMYRMSKIIETIHKAVNFGFAFKKRSQYTTYISSQLLKIKEWKIQPTAIKKPETEYTPVGAQHIKGVLVLSFTITVWVLISVLLHLFWEWIKSRIAG